MKLFTVIPGTWSYLTTSLPLMVRELTELSARRSTYIWRVIYATAIYGFTLWTLWREFGGRSDMPFEFLGRGRPLFEGLAMLQFGGIYLFLPAMTSGLLTAEKERDTLSLLLLTRLGPWSILLGKLLSRLIPMGAYILLSLPLVAVAYSMGGVNAVDILSLAWTLMATAFQIGALGLACSAWFRTTASSFIATYVLSILMIGALPIVTDNGSSNLLGIRDMLSAFYTWANPETSSYYGSEASAVWILFGPFACMAPEALNQPFPVIARRTLPLWLATGSFLLFSRVVLWRRAFLTSSHAILRFFRSLDTLFQKLNHNRVTRGIVLVNDHAVLPEWHPIRWRETRKRSLGTFRYLVRILLVLETLVLFLLLAADYNLPVNSVSARVTSSLLWILSTLIVTVYSTGLIGAERSRQTLDVLLTVPLSSESLVREKLAGVWRMILVLWIPFLTVFAFQVVWSLGISQFDTSSQMRNLGIVIPGLVGAALYLPLLAYLGFHAGMRFRTQTRATLAVLSGVTAWCALPLVFENLLSRDLGSIVRLFSPAWILNAREGIIGTLIHFFVIGAVLLFVRRQAYRQFSGRVNRHEPDGIDIDIERLASIRHHFTQRTSGSVDADPE